MKKKFLTALIFLFAFVSSAMAEPYLYSRHYSLAELKDGQSDFTASRFSHIWLDARTYDTAATEEKMNLSGTFTLDGGSYSFINGSVLSKVTGTPQTFSLEPVSNMTVGKNYIAYVPASGDRYMRFFIDAENGMKNVNASWNFPNAPAFNGSGTVPNLKTTAEQLADVVPAVEYIKDGDEIAGVKLKVVKSSDISTPVPQNFKMTLCLEEIWTASYEYSDLISTSSKDIAANETPEFDINFKTAINSSDLSGVTVMIEANDGHTAYAWRFLNFPESEKSLWANHVSEALLTDGKSDYSNAKFSMLALTPLDMARWAEAKFFTDEGRMTIPDGGYTLEELESAKELETVTGTKTFKLKMYSGISFMEHMVEYLPFNDNEMSLVFGGNAETGLNGKTITWTFPDELDMSGYAVVPNFKSTAEQLENAVPYVELTSADGKITSIKYKLVRSSDTSTAIKPAYSTDFLFYIEHTTGGYYYSDLLKEQNEGEWVLQTPQDLSTLTRVVVRVYSYEDETNPIVYQWNFMTPASEDEEQEQEQEQEEEKGKENTSSSGSGCDVSSLGILGFLISAAALKLKK